MIYCPKSRALTLPVVSIVSTLFILCCLIIAILQLKAFIYNTVAQVIIVSDYSIITTACISDLLLNKLMAKQV